MSENPSAREFRKPYSWLLFLLLSLFCLRVIGQALVAFFRVSFLPPMEEWFSGVLPYPELLASQILIIALFSKICWDFARGRGYFVQPRCLLGIWLLRIGWLYLAMMVTRYVIRMALYPAERWAGGSIPIFFHWILASFLLVLGYYQWAAFPKNEQGDFHHLSWRVRILQAISWGAVGLCVLLWVNYQVAPSVLAHELGFRRSQFAVRVQDHVPIAMTDQTTLRAEIFHPQHIVRTPTALIRISLAKTLKNSLFINTVGRMWAERGYTVVIQGICGRYESGGTFDPLRGERQDESSTLAWISKQSWFNGKIGSWGGSALGYTQWVTSTEDPREIPILAGP